MLVPGMNRASNIILGWLSLVWYTISFPVLFDYIFINISLEPAVGPCREAFGAESCRPLARVFLWLMELPINIVAFGGYALAIVVLEKYARKLQLSYLWLMLGVLSGYIALIVWAPDSDVHFSYYLVAALTYSIFVIVGVWACKHLTNQSMAPTAGQP